MQSLGTILMLIFVAEIQSQNHPYNNECVQLSNKYRAKHKSPPLTVDNAVVEFAKTRCKQVTQPGYLDNGHDAVAPPKHSENIYRSTADIKKVDCKTVIDKWYSEIKMHDFANPQFKEDTAHFVQLIWKGSTKMGCAKCDSKGDGTAMNTYVVCNYQKVATSKVPSDIKANILKA